MHIERRRNEEDEAPMRCRNEQGRGERRRNEELARRVAIKTMHLRGTLKFGIRAMLMGRRKYHELISQGFQH